MEKIVLINRAPSTELVKKALQSHIAMLSTASVEMKRNALAYGDDKLIHVLSEIQNERELTLKLIDELKFDENEEIPF